MDSSLTHLYILLDRSGSMSSLREGAVSGINRLVKTQTELEGQRCLVSIVQFDAPEEGVDWYKRTCWMVESRDFSPLQQHDFIPRGMTAYHRAACMLIDQAGEHLASIHESRRPGKVIFTMVTDGLENASGPDYPKERLRDKIKHQESKYAWEFLYVGANQDSYAVGANYGVSAMKCANFAPTSGGMEKMFDEIGVSALNYRSGKTANAVFDGPGIGVEK